MVVAFADCLSSAEVQAELDEAIVEGEMTVELLELQSQGNHVAESAELVEVATSGFVERIRIDLQCDPYRP